MPRIRVQSQQLLLAVYHFLFRFVSFKILSSLKLFVGFWDPPVDFSFILLHDLLLFFLSVFSFILAHAVLDIADSFCKTLFLVFRAINWIYVVNCEHQISYIWETFQFQIIEVIIYIFFFFHVIFFSAICLYGHSEPWHHGL